MHDRALDFIRILKIFRKLVPDAYEALVMRLNVVVVPAGAAVCHIKKKLTEHCLGAAVVRPGDGSVALYIATQKRLS